MKRIFSVLFRPRLLNEQDITVQLQSYINSEVCLGKTYAKIGNFEKCLQHFSNAQNLIYIFECNTSYNKLQVFNFFGSAVYKLNDINYAIYSLRTVFAETQGLY